MSARKISETSMYQTDLPENPHFVVTQGEYSSALSSDDLYQTPVG